MVYFSCSGCNESLKKPKVAKHLSFCRRCHVLTCLDCQKDFTAQSYVMHNQCVTELEKYSGRNYVEPANANKGQKKQMSWMDNVRAAVAAYSKQHPMDCRDQHQVNNLLSSLLRFDNIPRKKAKFDNFVKSAIGQFRRDQAAIDGAWAAISAPPPPPTEAVEAAAPTRKRKMEEENEKENEEEEEEATHEKEKKKKRNESEEEADEQTTEPKKKRKKTENNVQCSEESEEESKKKKKKKRKEESDEEAEEQTTEPKKKKKKGKTENGIEAADEQAVEEGSEEQATDSKFVLSTFITDLLQRRNGSGISFPKLEKRVVRAYVQSFARPNKEPRPERVKRKLKVVVAKHFRQIDGRVFERECI